MVECLLANANADAEVKRYTLKGSAILHEKLAGKVTGVPIILVGAFPEQVLELSKQNSKDLMNLPSWKGLNTVSVAASAKFVASEDKKKKQIEDALLKTREEKLTDYNIKMKAVQVSQDAIENARKNLEVTLRQKSVTDDGLYAQRVRGVLSSARVESIESSIRNAESYLNQGKKDKQTGTQKGLSEVESFLRQIVEKNKQYEKAIDDAVKTRVELENAKKALEEAQNTLTANSLQVDVVEKPKAIEPEFLKKMETSAVRMVEMLEEISYVKVKLDELGCIEFKHTNRFVDINTEVIVLVYFEDQPVYLYPRIGADRVCIVSIR